MTIEWYIPCLKQLVVWLCVISFEKRMVSPINKEFTVWDSVIVTQILKHIIQFTNTRIINSFHGKELNNSAIRIPRQWIFIDEFGSGFVVCTFGFIEFYHISIFSKINLCTPIVFEIAIGNTRP